MVIDLSFIGRKGPVTPVPALAAAAMVRYQFPLSARGADRIIVRREHATHGGMLT